MQLGMVRSGMHISDPSGCMPLMAASRSCKLQLAAGWPAYLTTSHVAHESYYLPILGLTSDVCRASAASFGSVVV